MVDSYWLVAINLVCHFGKQTLKLTKNSESLEENFFAKFVDLVVYKTWLALSECNCMFVCSSLLQSLVTNFQEFSQTSQNILLNELIIMH